MRLQLASGWSDPRQNIERATDRSGQFKPSDERDSLAPVRHVAATEFLASLAGRLNGWMTALSRPPIWDQEIDLSVGATHPPYEFMWMKYTDGAIPISAVEK